MQQVLALIKLDVCANMCDREIGGSYITDWRIPHHVTHREVRSQWNLSAAYIELQITNAAQRFRVTVHSFIVAESGGLDHTHVTFSRNKWAA